MVEVIVFLSASSSSAAASSNFCRLIVFLLLYNVEGPVKIVFGLYPSLERMIGLFSRRRPLDGDPHISQGTPNPRVIGLRHPTVDER